MPSFTERIGHRIRMLRTAKRMSQVEFADAVGIKQPYVNRLEMGNFKTVNPEILVKIAEVLNTTPNKLLGVEKLSIEAA